MKTYHIHINGLVQGVGFRPFVCQLAEWMGVKGWVSNTNNGVHIRFNATHVVAERFYDALLKTPPPNAIITHHHMGEVAAETFDHFVIAPSYAADRPDMLLTPDLAICPECRRELLDKSNPRYRYPFTTCLHCGPRFSIITSLPYDRENTTMKDLPLCPRCSQEYGSLRNRRHYSQTNSCPECAIGIHLYDASRTHISDDNRAILPMVDELLKSGAIVAVKGIGGYLLLCDATNEISIRNLRERKHRPGKPFALLYPDLEMAQADVRIRPIEVNALQGKAAPILLCRLREKTPSGICAAAIAPGLDTIGLMLPYTPLLLLLSQGFGKPLVATSANLSGSPIVYKDEDALDLLGDVADYTVTYDREIVLPQDDSVLQFTEREKRIILRRSRGLAPNYFPHPFHHLKENLVAMGGELKSAFAVLDHDKLYISQYLGNQASLDAQNAFIHTGKHFMRLLQAQPSRVLIDSHPGYFVSLVGKDKAAIDQVPLTAIQHHKAHFGAVLAENDLLEHPGPVLGVTWDGTGYGEDEQIWGSEFFSFENGEMQRVGQLDYFPQLLGDKMSREPRISALSLLRGLPAEQKIIQPHFTRTEWQYYQQLLQHPGRLLTSSMGRFLDGLASILGICQLNTYEGEAPMRLEVIARQCREHSMEHYPMPFAHQRLDWYPLLTGLLADIAEGREKPELARKIFVSLALAIAGVSEVLAMPALAFSGGVFQNALLTDLLIELLKGKKDLYFHRQLSPGDENIGFGQLACYYISTLQEKKTVEQRAASPGHLTESSI